MAEFDITAEIMSNLNSYSNKIADDVDELVKRTATDMMIEIQENSPVRKAGRRAGKRKPGTYKRGWRIKEAFSGKGNKRFIVHNSTSYQLTHLLENTHKGPNQKGIVISRPHIKPAEKKYTDKFLEQVKKVCQR